MVRTPFTTRLLPLARRWTTGALVRPPDRFHFDGRRLRWWSLAAGAPDALGYTLGLGAGLGGGEETWSRVGAALAQEGIPGTFVGPRGTGQREPAYRIVGARRLARLRELVGDPPPGVPPETWP